MRLYDETIDEVYNLLAPFEKRAYKREEKPLAEEKEYSLILKSDMAYELGGGSYSGVSGLAFTSSKEKFKHDEISVYGKDLDEISENGSFGRISIIRVGEDFLEDEEKAYSLMKKIEYAKYHVYPKGYMMRISHTFQKESVRVSKDAFNRGISFKEVGTLLEKAYMSCQGVLEVKTIFVTLGEFPYSRLDSLCGKWEKITDSLNHIWENVSMDCGSCGLKPVCDEVEGLRELHQARILQG